jgi:hypothetical protein
MSGVPEAPHKWGMTRMKIGDTLYKFDVNRRVYPKPEPGRAFSSGGPIYREHFMPLKIVGENKVSWVLEWNVKAPKKDADRIQKRILTAAEVDDDCWANDHRHRIRDLLQHCSVEHLREVARILGYRTPQ